MKLRVLQHNFQKQNKSKNAWRSRHCACGAWILLTWTTFSIACQKYWIAYWSISGTTWAVYWMAIVELSVTRDGEPNIFAMPLPANQSLLRYLRLLGREKLNLVYIRSWTQCFLWSLHAACFQLRKALRIWVLLSSDSKGMQGGCFRI